MEAVGAECYIGQEQAGAFPGEENIPLAVENIQLRLITLGRRIRYQGKAAVLLEGRREDVAALQLAVEDRFCLLYTSPSPRD